ncbi:hypothetical protein VNO77_26766 [Canavalia gladiata]|uniref:Uncharacterized protein n=1 Tax=Canavalia gladiata TaxID=3824 RepID=A0AAN9Q3M4_CANGL
MLPGIGFIQILFQVDKKKRFLAWLKGRNHRKNSSLWKHWQNGRQEVKRSKYEAKSVWLLMMLNPIRRTVNMDSNSPPSFTSILFLLVLSEHEWPSVLTKRRIMVTIFLKRSCQNYTIPFEIRITREQAQLDTFSIPSISTIVTSFVVFDNTENVGPIGNFQKLGKLMKIATRGSSSLAPLIVASEVLKDVRTTKLNVLGVEIHISYADVMDAKRRWIPFLHSSGSGRTVQVDDITTKNISNTHAFVRFLIQGYVSGDEIVFYPNGVFPPPLGYRRQRMATAVDSSSSEGKTDP